MKVPIIQAASPARIHLSENARIVLARRYLKKDDRGESTEAPEDMFRRVAANIAQAELTWGAARDAHVAEEQFGFALAGHAFQMGEEEDAHAGKVAGRARVCHGLTAPL